MSSLFKTNVCGQDYIGRNSSFGHTRQKISLFLYTRVHCIIFKLELLKVLSFTSLAQSWHGSENLVSCSPCQVMWHTSTLTNLINYTYSSRSTFNHVLFLLYIFKISFFYIRSQKSHFLVNSFPCSFLY